MTALHPPDLFMTAAGEDMMEVQTNLDQRYPVFDDIEVDIEARDQLLLPEDENMTGDGYELEEQLMQETDEVVFEKDEEMAETADEPQHEVPVDDELLVDGVSYGGGNAIDDFLLPEDLQDTSTDLGQNISGSNDAVQNGFATEVHFDLDSLDQVDEQPQQPQADAEHIHDGRMTTSGASDPEHIGLSSADGPNVPAVESNNQYDSIEQPSFDTTRDSLPSYNGAQGSKDYKLSGAKGETSVNDALEDFNFEGDDLLVSEDEDLGDLGAPEEQLTVPGPSFQGHEQTSTSGTNSVGPNAQIHDEGSIEQAEAHSQAKQSHVDSFEEHVHSIIVHYQENEISLFPPVTEDESSETYFLSDESLARESLRTILQACKSVLADSISEDDELEIKIPCLKLRVLETAVEADSTTLAQLINIYLQLHQNDGNSEPEPLHVLLSSKPRFHSQIDNLYSMLHAGKGFNHIQTSLVNIVPYEDLPRAENKDDSGNISQKGDDGTGLTVAYSVNEDRSGFQTPNDPRRGEEEEYELDFRSPATIRRATLGGAGQVSTVTQEAYATETQQAFEDADNTEEHEQAHPYSTTDDAFERVESEADEGAEVGSTQDIAELNARHDSQETEPESTKQSGYFSSSTLRGEASEEATGQASEPPKNTNTHSLDHLPTTQDEADDGTDHDEIGYDEDYLDFDEGTGNGETLTEHYPDQQDHYEEHFHIYNTDQTPPEQKTSSKSSGPPTTSLFDEDNEDEIDYEDDDELSHIQESTALPQTEHLKSHSPDSLKRLRSLEDDSIELSGSSPLDAKRMRST